jgi:hypothetical protein
MLSMAAAAAAASSEFPHAEASAIVERMGRVILCRHCQQTLRQAQSLKCSHHFCKECIEEMNTGAGELVRSPSPGASLPL